MRETVDARKVRKSTHPYRLGIVWRLEGRSGFGAEPSPRRYAGIVGQELDSFNEIEMSPHEIFLV
jgi:hypothetical protein